MGLYIENVRKAPKKHHFQHELIKKQCNQMFKPLEGANIKQSVVYFVLCDAFSILDYEKHSQSSPTEMQTL